VNILVTGATGFIGRHLVARLVNAGHKVRILTRGTGPIPSEWVGRVDVVTGNLLDKHCLQAALKGMAAAVNLAGVITDRTRMHEVNVEGARLLAETATKSGVSRLVHISSAGVVGRPTTDVVTEDTPCRPLTPYEQSKYDGEQAVLAVTADSRLETIVLRPTTVFGEGPRSGKDSLLEWMKVVQRGRFVFLGEGGMANYVYVGDVAEAIRHALEEKVKGKKMYLVADPTPLREFVAAMADALGVPAPTRQIPAWAAYTGAGLMEIGKRIGLPAPLTIARVRALTCNHRYLGDRFQETYKAFKPIGYRNGLKNTATWYRLA
jgi:nucleoside-diphosphate-sugar epimerase